MGRERVVTEAKITLSVTCGSKHNKRYDSTGLLAGNSCSLLTSNRKNEFWEEIVDF
jgi:hypothetical protein